MPDRKGTYSIEEIKYGFEKFLKENGHYPTSPEIDLCIYLPSSKQMQRNFGGVTKVREKIGLLDTNLGVGKFRTIIAYEANKKGFDSERKLEKILVSHFGEPFVHIEKPISTLNKRRFDFFIYAKKSNFGVDVYYSSTKKDNQKNINIKINNYINTTEQIYFVLANDSIPQFILDEIMETKMKLLPRNIKLVTVGNFIQLVKQMEPYV